MKEEPKVNETKEYAALTADIAILKSKIESLTEMNKAESERSSNLTEQLGELRGMLNDMNRNVSGIEVKAIKAVDIVESVKPDKITIDLQKSDGKIEALRSNIESNEEMMKALFEQLKQVRAQIEVFRGAEQILKLNEEVKREIMTVKKIEAVCEQHADKIETMFIEVQKTFKEFNEFEIKLDDFGLEIKEINSKLSKLEARNPALVTKKELSDSITGFSKDIEKAKRVIKLASDSYSKLDVNLKHAKRELQLEFDLKLNKAEMLSEAFRKLMDDNPLFAKGLNMQGYLNDQIRKIEGQLSDLKKSDEPDNSNKDTKISSGEVKADDEKNKDD
ncbi:MAG: hypothetical protein ACLFN8_00695 [Candidatus Woesearchaeota archaeon]